MDDVKPSRSQMALTRRRTVRSEVFIRRATASSGSPPASSPSSSTSWRLSSATILCVTEPGSAIATRTSASSQDSGRYSRVDRYEQARGERQVADAQREHGGGDVLGQHLAL